MELEVLISSMYQKDLSLISKMNIRSNALLINQYDGEFKEERIIDNSNNAFRMLSMKDRGLSKSRNAAIKNSEADICVIADDDLIYKDDYVKTILDAYQKHPDADVIAFDVPSINKDRPTSVLRKTKVGLLQSMKLASFQLTFKRRSILKNDILFNDLFGAGSIFTCGEENIWLSRCLKSGLKIRYISEEIALVNHKESTWFNGFDEAYLKTKGAMFYEISSILWLALILQYAVRKYKLYRSGLSILKAIRLMFIGRSEYKSMLLKGKRQYGSSAIDTQNDSLFLVWGKAKK